MLSIISSTEYLRVAFLMSRNVKRSKHSIRMIENTKQGQRCKTRIAGCNFFSAALGFEFCSLVAKKNEPGNVFGFFPLINIFQQQPFPGEKQQNIKTNHLIRFFKKKAFIRYCSFPTFSLLTPRKMSKKCYGGLYYKTLQIRN